MTIRISLLAFATAAMALSACDSSSGNESADASMTGGGAGTDMAGTDGDTPVDVAGVSCDTAAKICMLEAPASSPIADDFRMVAGYQYVLKGAVFVGDDLSATTLTIEPGVTI